MPSDSVTFWLLAVGMIAAALAFVVPRLFGATPSRRGPTDDATNTAVYRSELAALQAERDAGTLAPAEYALTRAELERRLLDDVEEKTALARPGVRVRVAGLAVALALPMLAVGLYFAFGTPAALSVPASVQAEGALPPGDDFRAQLLAHLADAPRDGRAWVALARLDMNEDRFDAAAKHYAKAIDVSPKIARDPDLLCEYADALGMGQGGRLEGAPAEVIARALVLDPANPKALEMAGSAAYERRDFRTAAMHWRALMQRMPEGTPAHVELAAAVERAERLATTTLPPGSAPARGS